MMIYFNSHETEYKNPFGAVVCGTLVQFRIRVTPAPTEVFCVINQRPLPMEQETECSFVLRYTAPQETVFYSFLVCYGDQQISYGNRASCCGGKGEEGSTLPFQLTVYDASHSVPDWFYDAIVYQIFPDRFYRSDTPPAPRKNSFFYGSWEDTPLYIRTEDGEIARWDFYGGDLYGIMEKLPYLHSLGINTLYLNPIFSARSNHRYDTADYEQVDALLGGNSALAELLQKAKEYSIRILLDGVFNHTGAYSRYFDIEDRYGNGAYAHPDSPYRSWYTFQEDGSYDCWWGIRDLPALNELEPGVLSYLLTDEDSILKRWLRLGISGWRLDVADELPDAFLQILKKECRRENPEAVVIGEVWEDASNKISYGKRRSYFSRCQLDSVTNYPFRRWMLDFLQENSTASELCEHIMGMMENYPAQNFYANLNLISSHDVERIASLLTLQQRHLLTVVQFTFAGVPHIYYGDEAGLCGGTDPDNRRPFPWGKEDTTLQQWFQRLIALRNQYRVFRRGTLHPFAEGDDLFGFYRRDNTHQSLTVINRSPYEKILTAEEDGTDLLTEQTIQKGEPISVPPMGYRIIMQSISTPNSCALISTPVQSRTTEIRP